VLREKFRNSKIIVLHVDDSFSQIDDQQSNIPILYGTANVQDFLEREVPEIDPSNIRIIEWRPSMNHYGESYVKLLSGAVEFIKRIDAGKRTVSVFGRRWVKNFFKNLKNVHHAILYRAADIPVIITGSGPSLEKALPVIRNMREKSLIIAASSSIMALNHGGVQPDLVITTDGGTWALKHIYPYFRNPNTNAAIAANLCAALPSQCANTPLLILNDGSFWQSVILHELDIPSVIIPQMGTVTASALELALLLSKGNIFLAGMDLSVRDIRTHARPYSFDHLLFEKADRFLPVYSQSFVRSSLIQQGGGLGIYAAWFKNRLASLPDRIFTIGENNEVFKDGLSTECGEIKNTNECFKTVSVKGNPDDFCKRGITALLNALNDNKYADNLKKELIPLLFPGEEKAELKNLEKAILELSNG